MAFCLVDLDKESRVLLVGIREVIYRFLAKWILLVTDAKVIEAWGNLNIWDGLVSSIEGSILANLMEYIKYILPPASYQALLYGVAASEEGKRRTMK